jgi:hypothetical protein
MYHEVELQHIIRASILASLDETLEDGYSHVELDTVSLLDRLADQFRQKRGDTDLFESDEDGGYTIEGEESFDHGKGRKIFLTASRVFSPHQAPLRARRTKLSKG